MTEDSQNRALTLGTALSRKTSGTALTASWTDSPVRRWTEEQLRTYARAFRSLPDKAASEEAALTVWSQKEELRYLKLESRRGQFGALDIVLQSLAIFGLACTADFAISDILTQTFMPLSLYFLGSAALGGGSLYPTIKLPRMRKRELARLAEKRERLFLAPQRRLEDDRRAERKARIERVLGSAKKAIAGILQDKGEWWHGESLFEDPDRPGEKLEMRLSLPSVDERKSSVPVKLYHVTVCQLDGSETQGNVIGTFVHESPLDTAPVIRLDNTRRLTLPEPPPLPARPQRPPAPPQIAAPAPGERAGR